MTVTTTERDDAKLERPGGFAASRQPSSGMGHEAAPSAGQIEMTNVSWAAPNTLTFDRWVVQGRRLGTIGRGIGWWIGDWLRFGNLLYGEKYVQAAKITGYDSQTLMNMVYVASSIDPSRRLPELSFSHHAEVAALSPEEQDHWLNTAKQSRLSVHDLRLMLRLERNRQESDADIGHAEPGADTDAICPECGHAFRPLTDR
jgi:hypothetical protein